MAVVNALNETGQRKRRLLDDDPFNMPPDDVFTHPMGEQVFKFSSLKYSSHTANHFRRSHPVAASVYANVLNLQIGT